MTYRAYDLETVAAEFYGRHAKRTEAKSTWEQLPDALRSYVRFQVRDAITCYERHLAEAEEKAKREAKRAAKKTKKG